MSVPDALYDTGSEPDAVSAALARQLKQKGVAWGEPGGHLTVANSAQVQPVGTLRILISCDPSKHKSVRGGSLNVPRPIMFITDAEIVEGLTHPLILGYPTLRGTGLLPVIFGLEEYTFEPSVNEDIDEVDELWPDELPSDVVMPTINEPESADGRAVRRLCEQYSHLFGPPPLGGSRLPPMDIELKRNADGTEMHPGRQRARPVTPWVAQLIREDTEMRLQKGWYRWPAPGETIPYASPMVAAPQPSKGPQARRICADYTKLNKCAVETMHPVKNQEAARQRLRGGKKFCNLDMLKGYHQVKCTQRAQLLLACATPDGIVIPTTCPFGFHGLPAYFQHLMDDVVFAGLGDEGLTVYMDDINTACRDNEHQLWLLEQIFIRMERYDLRFGGKKCFLNYPYSIFMGKKNDGDGCVHTDERIRAVTNMQRPHTKEQLGSFLGLCAYFSGHLGMQISSVMQPLHQLNKRNAQFVWQDKHTEAFDATKQLVAQQIKLYYIDYTQQIYIRCDASKVGVGAQLFQVVDGRERSIYFMSKAFSTTESKWSTIEQEVYAMVLSCKRWKHLLEGHRFTVLTDHKNILWLQKQVAPKLVRWRLSLQQFNYTVLHVAGAGARHAVADCLSRLHGAEPTRRVSVNAVTRSQTAAQTEAAQERSAPSPSLAVALPEASRLAQKVADPSTSNHTRAKSKFFSSSKSNLADPPDVMRPAAPTDSTDITLHNAAFDGRAVVTTTNEPTALVQSGAGLPGDGISGGETVARKQQRARDISPRQPKKRRQQRDLTTVTLPAPAILLIRSVHNDVVGHHGEARTMKLLRERYAHNTPRTQMPTRVQVARFISQCVLCQKIRLPKSDAPAPMHTLAVTRCWQEISVDAIGPLPETVEGYKHILVAVDNLSRFVCAEPAKDTSSQSAARFIHRLSGQFGWPEAFRWDNSTQFDNTLITALVELVGVERHESVPFNPSTNGVVERTIQEVIRHLRYLVNSRRDKARWVDYLPIVLRILNATPHGATGLAPAQIIMPGLNLNANMYPVDYDALNGAVGTVEAVRSRDEVRRWVQHLQELQRQAMLSATRRQQHAVSKRVVAESADTRSFSIGDWVVCPWRGGRPHKLAVAYRGPYEVVEKLSAHRYAVRDPADDVRYFKHVREMHRYRVGPDENVVDSIAIDEHEEIVDCVVDHHRDPSSRRVSDYDFRVRFVGSTAADDVWMSYKELTRKRGVKPFWDYVRAHPELGITVRD